MSKTESNGSVNRLTDAENPKGIAITIRPAAMAILKVLIEGTSPYCQLRFSEKAQQMMKDAQEAGSTAKKGKKREAKDFDACYKEALYATADGWNGLHAGGIRTAMVSACRICGFKMTHAKLAAFVEADGFDHRCGSPMVRMTKGSPKKIISPMRNANGAMDLRARAFWDPGWQAIVKVMFDSDVFTPEDALNLLSRVGVQVGIGEGRHDSKDSTGCAWGCFKIVGLVN